MKIFSKKLQAFTLLETLTSIAILAIVIVGPLTVIINSSGYARQTKDTIIATYLAEESVELLQNQYDSLYIYCNKQLGSGPCTTSTGETGGQIAWRVFKERLAVAPSCFSSTPLPPSPPSCSFDYIDMAGDITSAPSHYDPTDTSSGAPCSFLIEASTTAELHTYLCKGISAHIGTSVVAQNKQYKRKVTLEDIPASFETVPPYNYRYDDDIRITAEIEFKGIYATSSVKITKFMHAQP